jgi:hypothetical protein
MGGKGSGAQAKDTDARRAARWLMACGKLRPAEAARLAGVSLQVANGWLKAADIDWRKMRDHEITRLWRKELKNGLKLVERS